jgi:hypothetical protein
MSGASSNRTAPFHDIMPRYQDFTSGNNTPLDINNTVYGTYFFESDSTSNSPAFLINFSKFDGFTSLNRRTWISPEEISSETATDAQKIAHFQADISKIDELIRSDSLEEELWALLVDADQAKLQVISDRIKRLNASDIWDEFINTLSCSSSWSNHDDAIAFLADAFSHGKASERAPIAAALGKIGSGIAISFLRNARMKEGNRFVLSVINAYLDNQNPR